MRFYLGGKTYWVSYVKIETEIPIKKRLASLSIKRIQSKE